MAKRRRSSKKPNLPQSTLERARRQADGSADTPEEMPEKAAAPVQEKPKASSAESRRRKVNPAQLERSRQRGELTHEMIESMLHNPTVTVTQEQLREDYGHVLLDLRNMGLLAAVLFVVLVALAQFI
ncbi:MAG: hypothetical protein KC496_15525 [Anaerolineae bacterium]|nr:hypothetical protein [Anaerolineae bacterium]